MKLLLNLLIFSTSLSCFSQISITNVSKDIPSDAILAYDSLSNYLGVNVKQYIGQELYVLGKDKFSRHFGYSGFYENCVLGKVYKSDKRVSTVSDYKALASKTLHVLDAFSHPKSDLLSFSNNYILKLVEKESSDTIYYVYNSKSDLSFPFITLGYIEKMKTKLVDIDFVSRGRNWINGLDEMKDVKTGLDVDFSADINWKCVDLTIDERFYNLSMLLQNEKGEHVLYSVDYVDRNDNYFMFKKDEYEKLMLKFGSKIWQKILSGNIEIGFTEEMCTYAWGKPISINKSSYGAQWVYDNQYLYFTNGKLKSFNQS